MKSAIIKNMDVNVQFNYHQEKIKWFYNMINYKMKHLVVKNVTPG